MKSMTIFASKSYRAISTDVAFTKISKLRIFLAMKASRNKIKKDQNGDLAIPKNHEVKEI